MKTIRWKAEVIDDGKPMPEISTGADVVKMLREEGMADRDREVFAVLAFNCHRQFIGWEPVSVGTGTSTVAEVQECFATAIGLRSKRIIIAHNHPSGNVEPSGPDAMVTMALKASAEVLGIDLVDHVIVGAGTNDFYSFREGAIVAAEEEEVKKA